MSKFFTQTDQSLPIMLLRAREAVMKRFRPILKAHDLSEQQWRVLRVLDERGALEPTNLAERCVILTPSLTRILSHLAARGLIARTPHAQDKRKQIISITKSGQTIVAEIAPVAAEAYARIEAYLGKPQMHNLLNKLGRLSEMGQ
jgi:homoprotocatechuate degradation regulator HpaR